MTGLFLQVLGLLASGLVYPLNPGIMPTIYTTPELQQLYQEELERNHQAEQDNIIIEDYFSFADKIGKIKYARGCMGEYGNNNCSDNAFDCGGAMKAYLIAKGIISVRDAKRHNSRTLYELGIRKDPRTAKRGDFMFRRGYGEVASGRMSTHFAVVSRDYDGGSFRIYDNVVPGGQDMYHEREIRVGCTKDFCYYANKYIINVASNGAIELAKINGVDVLPREDAIKVDPNNPKDYAITIKGYPYDSIANEVANRRYENSSGDSDMIATRLCENGGFNPNSISYTNDHGLCQLNYNKTNKRRIDDPERLDIDFQKQACLDKRQAVQNKNLWACYAKRKYYLSKIVYLK